MANEAILKDRLTEAIDFTVADGTAILKGTICALTDPRTAIAVSSTGQMLAGIAARDKIASDGRTRLGMFTKGVFDMRASGAIAVGQPVVACANNGIILASGGQSGAAILGYALETASDTEVIQVMVNIGAGGGAL